MASVFIGVGHGGKDPGATAYGMKEKEINLDIALFTKDVLEKHGVKVILSRTTNEENDPVKEEVKEANASGATVAWSIHTNAGGGDGSESLYHGNSSSGKKLAGLCEAYVKDICGQNSRGIKARDDLWFLRGTNMPAALSECAFIDNDKDNDIIDTLAERQKFGLAYARAILDYLGVKYSGNKTQDLNKDGRVDAQDALVMLKKSAGMMPNSEQYNAQDALEVLKYSSKTENKKGNGYVRGVVTGSNVCVRSGAGTNFSKIDYAQKGQEVLIWAVDGDWYMVDVGKWINKGYVTIK